MTNKPGAALVDDYLRRAREGSHSYAVVPLEALKIACADLDAARELIAINAGAVLCEGCSKLRQERLKAMASHPDGRDALRDLRERLQR